MLNKGEPQTHESPLSYTAGQGGGKHMGNTKWDGQWKPLDKREEDTWDRARRAPILTKFRMN